MFAQDMLTDPKLSPNFRQLQQDRHPQLTTSRLPQVGEKWIMQDLVFFHLGTTLVGIDVTDTYLLANHHKLKLMIFSWNTCEEKRRK
jgi:hypothetical protein